MLVDPDAGAVRAVSRRALAAHRDRAGSTPDGVDTFGAETAIAQELFRQQIETGTAPCPRARGASARLAGQADVRERFDAALD